MGYKEILDKMTWSFSRLHLFEECPYAFYLRYIEEREGIPNFYAENGSINHSIFEKVVKGELKLIDAPEFYLTKYDCICSQVKQSTMDNIFNKCLDYLCTVEELDLNKYEVLGVEKKCEFKIKKYTFTGFIDLLLKNKETNEILLIDHKSADHFLKKDGSVLKNAMNDFSAYSHQMYLYCKQVYNEFGVFPNKIIWHHFKDMGELTIIDFDEKQYLETLDWAVRLIKKIYREKKYLPVKNYFRCWQLCDYRDGECEYKND